MATKDFQKKYMHPTRRKLVDMVHSGEHEKSITLGYAGSKNLPKKREIGENWVDENGQEWEQKAGYKVKKNRITELMSEVRSEIYSKTQCKRKGNGCDVKGKYGYTDKQLIAKTGYCSGCLATLEHQIRVDELYVPYENFKVMGNMIKEGYYVLEQLQQAYQQAKQEYEYVDSDGRTQKWAMERNVDELKKEIMDEIQKMQEEINVVSKKRLEVYNLLKDRNYELVEHINTEFKEEMAQ